MYLKFGDTLMTIADYVISTAKDKIRFLEFTRNNSEVAITHVSGNVSIASVIGGNTDRNIQFARAFGYAVNANCEVEDSYTLRFYTKLSDVLSILLRSGKSIEVNGRKMTNGLCEYEFFTKEDCNYILRNLFVDYEVTGITATFSLRSVD